jgi:membrane protein YdbS with pleckstrin-like domain
MPAADTVPEIVNRHLLPWERQVITVHRHPAILIGPIFVVLVGLAAAFASSRASAFSSDARLIIWITWGLLFLYLIGKTISWPVDYFVVTPRRMLVVKGFLTRDVAMIPYSGLTGLKLRRSTMGRLIGYGQFILEPAGQDQALRTVSFLPYPEQLYLEVCGLIFPNREEPELD